MRIRTVKPEFWKHAVMAQLPAETQLLALALLNMADDHGYFEADPRIIRGEVMPFREDLATVSRDIRELVRVGWIEVREAPGHSAVGWVVNWSKHQRVDHPKDSKLVSYFDNGVPREIGATFSREPRDASREEVEGEVEQGGEVEGELFPPASRAAPRAKKPKEGKPVDPRHAPLVKALVRACPGYPWDGGRDAAAVTKLLAVATPEAIVAGWAAALRHVGYPKVATVYELQAHWAHFRPGAKRQGYDPDDGIIPSLQLEADEDYVNPLDVE